MNLFDQGIQYLRENKLKKALDIFSKLIQQNPSNGDYWSERGVTYFHLGEKEKAIADMNKAVELQPNKPYRYSSRAYIFGQYKMTQAAIKDYEKAIELDPNDAVAQNNLGLLQEQLGYISKAKKHFKAADNLVKSAKGSTDFSIQGEPLNARNIQKEIDEEKKNQSLWKEIKSLTTREGRASFKRFIKSGFKQT